MRSLEYYFGVIFTQMGKEFATWVHTLLFKYLFICLETDDIIERHFW